MNIEELKRLAEANYGWRNAYSAWPHQSNDGSAVVGNIDDERDPNVKNPVAVVDLTIYDAFEGDSLQLAQFYAAANPAAILELIRQRDELLAALEQERKRLDWAMKHEACYYQWGGVWRLCFSSTTGPCDEDIDSTDPRATIDELMAK